MGKTDPFTQFYLPNRFYPMGKTYAANSVSYEG